MEDGAGKRELGIQDSEKRLRNPAGKLQSTTGGLNAELLSKADKVTGKAGTKWKRCEWASHSVAPSTSNKSPF